MVNYNDSKIYKLVSFQTEKCYVGSTTQSLGIRKASHKCDYKRWLNGNRQHKITSFEIVKYDDCDAILIENYSCNNKEELHARERHWIEKLDCVNKTIPGRTDKEWREANKDIIRQKHKVWEEANKEELKKKGKEYRESHKEELQQYFKNHSIKNKEKIKEYKVKYQLDNKTKLNAISKAYYEKNKHESNKMIPCICGSSYCKTHENRHLNSKLHARRENLYYFEQLPQI